MHSLRASVVFVSISVFAFLTDNGTRPTAFSPETEELVQARFASEDLSPARTKALFAADQNPFNKKKRTKVTRIVRATAYNALAEQTDASPDICAWGDKIRPGIIAISRDLEKSGLTRGKEVHIEGIGKVVVMDRMHHRKRNQIDLYMERYEDAVEFGVKELTISWTEEPNTEHES